MVVPMVEKDEKVETNVDEPDEQVRQDRQDRQDGQDAEVTTMRPAVRSEDNRERILTAARRAFAEQGYRGATLRAIAGEVGVDVALIAHYFGNKQGLYAEAMAMPDRAYVVVQEALSAPAEQAGEVLARGYLGLWEDPETGRAMSAITHSSLTDSSALDSMNQIMAGRMGDEEFLALSEGRRQGLVLAFTGLMGAAISRHLVKAPAVADLEFEEFVRRAAVGAQAQLDLPDTGELPREAFIQR